MSTTAFVGLFVLTLGCIALAQRMALSRARSTRLWMWSAAFLGPLPLAILAFLPNRR